MASRKTPWKVRRQRLVAAAVLGLGMAGWIFSTGWHSYREKLAADAEAQRREAEYELRLQELEGQLRSNQHELNELLRRDLEEELRQREDEDGPRWMQDVPAYPYPCRHDCWEGSIDCLPCPGERN